MNRMLDIRDRLMNKGEVSSIFITKNSLSCFFKYSLPLHQRIIDQV